MKKIIGLLFVACFVLTVSVAKAGVLDSIGVEKKDGKRYVLHRIEAKETLYALSKKYGASVDEIKKANAEVNISDLKIGQVIRIPKEEKAAAKQNTSTASKQIHVVLPGETLYSIAKKYNVSVDELKKANPKAASSGLSIGDEITVPSKSAVAEKPKPTTEQVTTQTNPTLTAHKVAAGETLYSISKKYNVPVADLKKFNPGVESGLKVGQSLALTAAAAASVKPDEVIAAETKIKETLPKETVKKDTQDVVAPAPIDTVLTSDQEKEKKYLDSMSNIKVVPNGEFKKVTETGFAEMIEGGESDKYLALHKTAPVGTIIQVINDANNQRIFVRVIGKLPANGMNDKVVLKISKKAYTRLAGVDKKIPVTLSYIM